MTYSEADKLITEYLASRWTTTPVAWPNMEPRNFQAIGQPLLPTGSVNYVALRSHGTGSQAITVTGSCIRYSGQLFVAVCVKEGTGVRVARGYVDSLVAILENATLRGSSGTVRLGSVTGPAGYAAPSGWYVEELGIMFHFERFTQ